MRCSECHMCPVTGEALVHLIHRGPHESSSPFGQFIHDQFGNDFYRVDDDQATHYKRATRIWRDLEHKFIGQQQSPGQVVTMQKRALAARELVERQVLHPASGSFVVFSDIPFTWGSVQQVDPLNGALGEPRHLDGESWARFLTGYEIP